MAALFAKPDAPSQFATKIGWQDCLARLLVKKQLVPDLDHSSVSVDESVSISASEDAAESMPLSPTHFIEMAAKTYLPENAGNAVERIGKVVETTRRKVSDARGLAQEGVARTQQTILGKVQDLSEKATFRMRSVLKDICSFCPMLWFDTCINHSLFTAVKENDALSVSNMKSLNNAACKPITSQRYIVFENFKPGHKRMNA